MKLRLAPHALTHALMDDMREALGRMEAGDYDGAYRVLEERCRPADPATDIRPGFDAGLHLRRAMLELTKHMPEGLLRARHMLALEASAVMVAQAFAPGDWIKSTENALAAARSAAEFGVSLEFDYTTTDWIADINERGARLFPQQPNNQPEQ